MAITFGEGSSGRNYAFIQRPEKRAGVKTVEHT